MIIQGHPELGLQAHQQAAYKAVTEAYTKGNKASVVIPTGCGKSFIALQLMEDNRDKNILFIAPTNAIKNQMYAYIAKYIVGDKNRGTKNDVLLAQEHFPNLKIILYPSLLRMGKEVMDKLQPDVVIMDELHRTGAELWGDKVTQLVESYPNAKILGVTATPDRMDDKNVIDEMFEGNVNYELTLVDAISKGIVNPPDYVKCDYSLRDELETIQTIIAECKDEETKKGLQERYDKMRKIVENAEGIPELFANNMRNRQGKYIIFCKDEQHMREMMEKSQEWFGAIDKEPEIYSVISKDGQAQNRKVIDVFTESKSEHLKLLYSVDMLNEGLHVEDISGVIMLRPTDSRIIYLQQLGRALSSDTSREKTIVFDIVNNYIKNNLDREINVDRNERDRERTANTKEAKEIEGTRTSGKQLDIDTFRIQGETKEFLALLAEVKEISGYSSMLSNAREIEKWMQERNTTKPPRQQAKEENEKRLGQAMSNIRQNVIKPYNVLETEEERQKYLQEHPEYQEVIAIISRIDENNISPYLANVREIEKWMQERNTTKPPSNSAKGKDEKRLGKALITVRYNVIKPYNALETEEERRKYLQEHPEYQEVISIVSRIDENNISPYLANAREIEKWMQERNTTKPPKISSKDADEKRLGKRLDSIRYYIIKPYNALETEEEKQKYLQEHPEYQEVISIVSRIDKNNISPYLANAREIEKWMQEKSTKKLPSESARDKEESRLGVAFGTIKRFVIKPYNALETEEERQKYLQEHPEYQEVISIVSRIDENRKNKQSQVEALAMRSKKLSQQIQQARNLEQQYYKITNEKAKKVVEQYD